MCVGVELAVGVGVPALDVGVAGPVAPGENVAGVPEGEDPAQAETDTEASMAKAAHPATVSRVLSPVPLMVVRIFMRPPMLRLANPFPVPAAEDKARGRPRHAMAYSSLEY